MFCRFAALFTFLKLIDECLKVPRYQFGVILHLICNFGNTNLLIELCLKLMVFKIYDTIFTKLKNLEENRMKYICSVCGYKGLDEPAYHNLKKFEGGSFEICECCRFQYGVDDDVELENGDFLSVRDAHNIYRNIWLSFDAPVFMSHYYPAEYQENGKVKREYLEKQLKNIGISLNE